MTEWFLFRAGSLEVAGRSLEQPLARLVDDHRPASVAVGLRESLFCCRTLDEAFEWGRWACLTHSPEGVELHALAVVCERLFAYPVSAWDRMLEASASGTSDEQVASLYWAAGVPLDMLGDADDDPIWEKGVEVLVSPAAIGATETLGRVAAFPPQRSALERDQTACQGV